MRELEWVFNGENAVCGRWKVLEGHGGNAKVSNVSQLLHQTAVDVERLVHALPELKQISKSWGARKPSRMVHQTRELP